MIKWAKEMCDAGCISEMRWCDTRVCLAGALTKPGSMTSDALLNVCRTGNMINLRETDKNTDRENVGGKSRTGNIYDWKLEFCF